MHFLILLAIQVVLSVLSALLFRPKPPKSQAVQIPTTDPSIPIAVLFGRLVMSGNVIAFLNYRPHAVDQGVYNYSASMVVALCLGEITKLWDIISDTGQRFSEIADQTRVVSQSGDAFTGITYTTTTVHSAGYAATPAVSALPWDVQFQQGGTGGFPSSPGGDVAMVLSAPRIYGDRLTGGGVTGNVHFYPGTRNQPMSDFWATFPLPAMPGVAYEVTAAGVVTVNLFFQRDIQSIRYAVSTTLAPDFAAVTGGTLISGAPWSFTYSALSSGQTLYVGVLGYNALGTASPLGSFTIGPFSGGALSGQPLAVGSPGSTLGTVPPMPRLCYVTYENTILGQSSTPRPLGWELQRTPNGGFPEELFRDDAHSQNVGDANPIAIIYELMTDRLWGIGLDDSELDIAGSWLDASFTLCGSPNTDLIFLSYLLDTQGAAHDYIDEILRTIDAVRYTDPLTGKIGIKLIRGDYSIGALPVFNNANVLDCDFTRALATETVNEVRVTFTDRARLYRKNQVPARNVASIHALGRVISSTVEYKGVTREDLALRLAQRDLRALSQPLAKATLVVNRSAFDLHEGSPFLLSWTRDGTSVVSEMVMRVGKITRSGRDDSTLSVECLQDVFALPASAAFAPSGVTYVSPSAAMPNSVPTITAITDRTATVGALALIIDDPDSRITKVEFQHQSGQSTLSAWAVASAPYHDQVTLDPNYSSLINWRVTYGMPDGTLDSLTGTATFDVQQKPPAPALSFTIDATGHIAVTATVAANVASVKFADATSAPPSDATTRAGSPVTPSAGLASYTPTASPLVSGTDYVTAFAYDADGNESQKRTLTISSVSGSQPVTIDDETGTIAGSRQLIAGSGSSINTGTAGKVKVDVVPVAFAPLVDGATITWATGGVATPNAAVTIAGNRTLAITGAVSGQCGTLEVVQGSGGSHTLTLPAGSIVLNGGGGAIALSTGAGDVDLLSYIYDGTHYLWAFGKKYT